MVTCSPKASPHWVDIPAGADRAHAARAVIGRRCRDARRILKRLVKAASQQSCDAPRRMELVHDLRVACRRAIAAVRFFQPLLARKAARRTRKWLRRVRRTAGTVRELDVLASTINGRDDPVLRYVAEHILPKQRRNHWRRSVRKLKKLYRELRRKKSDSIIRPKKKLTRTTYITWASQQLADQALALATHFAQPCRSWEEWHRLRIRVKQFRYSAEFLARLVPAVARIYPLIEDLQEKLGEINDITSCLQWLSTWQDKIPRRLHRGYALLVRSFERRREAQLQQLSGWIQEQRFAEILTALAGRVAASTRPFGACAGWETKCLGCRVALAFRFGKCHWLGARCADARGDSSQVFLFCEVSRLVTRPAMPSGAARWPMVLTTRVDFRWPAQKS
ncbi:MAG: hypothetical protein KatS3mg110_0191 [Pirellulaceae bacterium]|nr:MAG: hypothetical protein KatS3mg110_0191 [Pirellulaceae bacterium]